MRHPSLWTVTWVNSKGREARKQQSTDDKQGLCHNRRNPDYRRLTRKHPKSGKDDGKGCSVSGRTESGFFSRSRSRRNDVGQDRKDDVRGIAEANGIIDTSLFGRRSPHLPYTAG